jgi:hypothetical protein
MTASRAEAFTPPSSNLNHDGDASKWPKLNACIANHGSRLHALDHDHVRSAGICASDDRAGHDPQIARRSDEG